MVTVSLQAMILSGHEPLAPMVVAKNISDMIHTSLLGGPPCVGGALGLGPRRCRAEAGSGAGLGSLCNGLVVVVLLHVLRLFLHRHMGELVGVEVQGELLIGDVLVGRHLPVEGDAGGALLVVALRMQCWLLGAVIDNGKQTLHMLAVVVRTSWFKMASARTLDRGRVLSRPMP